MSWLLPAALICLLVLLWVSPAGRPHRPDPGRGPAVGRLAAVHRAGVQLHERHHPPVLHGRARPGDRRADRHRARWQLWRARHGWPGRIAAAVAVGVTGGLGVRAAGPDAVLAAVAALGDRCSPGWPRAAAILAGPRLATAGQDRTRRPAGPGRPVPVALALVAGLAGPAAYALDTVATAHTGSLPTAGPQTAAFGGPGGGPGGTGGRAARPGGGSGGPAGAAGTGPARTGTGQGRRRRAPGARAPAGTAARPAPAAGAAGVGGGRARRAQRQHPGEQRAGQAAGEAARPATRGWRPPKAPRRPRRWSWPPAAIR